MHDDTIGLVEKMAELMRLMIDRTPLFRGPLQKTSQWLKVKGALTYGKKVVEDKM